MVSVNKVIETAAGGNLGLLITKLASLTLSEFSELKAISGNIDWLKEELEILHAVLLDLSDEENPSHQQKLWKNRVRELSYDMEDAIDEFELASRRSSGIQEAGASNFIRRAVQSIQSCIERIKKLPFDFVIAQKIQSLKSRVDLSEERHNRLKTGRGSGEGSSNDAIAIRDLAQYADPDGLVGIDAPRKDIISMLTHDQGSSALAHQRKVVAIVGFGGLGKTTLAKQVFDKIISAGGFTCKAFVTVSRSPDINKILTDIMVDFKLTDKPEELRQLDRRQLTNKLREYVQNKRYLVVIDDVWSVDAWKFIEAALYDNNLGSRIIVTTRKNDVAEECRRSKNGDVYRLDPLGYVEAEQLFIAKAFPHKGCPPNLVEVCHKVLKKCGGSPLAILTLSGLLANKDTADEWERVLDSLSYAVLEDDSDANLVMMRRILSFSYFDLPHHLRTCLLYMSIFPEDAVIKRKRLVSRWIAQGFISSEARCKTETGEHYFNELISRCLIQPVNIKYDGRARACKVHDTILDFIKHKSKEEDFVAFLGAQEGRPKHKARHLSIQDFEKFTGLAEHEEVSPARSLTISGSTNEVMFYDSFSKFTRLRVLDLEDYVPSYGARYDHCDTVIDVSQLFQLKYLATGQIYAKSIKGIINLQCLETLDLRESILEKFPGDIYELQHLVRLFIDKELILPSGIGKMKALEELKCINAEDSSLEFLQELGCLAKLRSVSVKLVENTERDQEKELILINSLRKLGMDGRNYLECLTVNALGYGSIGNLDDSNGLSWREALLNIRKLKMNRVYLTKIPVWMGSLNHLEKLELLVEDMGQEDLDILAELHSLIYLYLEFDYYPEEGLTFRGTTTLFQCLKYLRIDCDTRTKLTFESLPWLQHLQIRLGRHPLPDSYHGVELPDYYRDRESPDYHHYRGLPYYYHDRELPDSDDDEEFPPSGFSFYIGHLHSLTRVSVYVSRWCIVNDGQLSETVHMIKDAVLAHPNKPKLIIDMNSV